jgi:hypothetical protein
MGQVILDFWILDLKIHNLTSPIENSEIYSNANARIAQRGKQRLIVIETQSPGLFVFPPLPWCPCGYFNTRIGIWQAVIFLWIESANRVTLFWQRQMAVSVFRGDVKMAGKLYRDYNSYLREIFGRRVQKITLDAGLSCPNRDGTLGRGGCIYCNAKGSGTGAARFAGISEQIRTGKERLSRKYKAGKFIAYFQSFSNTYAPLPRLAEIYGEALADPDIVGLNIGTRPDCVSDEKLDYLSKLAESHLICMEYGLQSAKEETLALIRRGHTVSAFVDAVERTRRRRLSVCAHVILGLPGENMEDMIRTAKLLAGLDVEAVKIHLLYVVKGTVLEDMYKAGEYLCLTREEYAAAAGEFLAHLSPGAVIQRLTGDPHPEELVAPAWALDKQRNLEAVRSYMREKALHQGIRCAKNRFPTI